MRESSQTRSRRIGAAGFAIALVTISGCTRENVCYEPQEMPEFGHILRAVPCDEANEAPESER